MGTIMNTITISGRDIPWLPDDEYKKCIFQFRGQLMNIMRPLELYGQKPIVDEAIEQIVKLTEDFGLRVRGIEKIFITNPRIES
jgi:hypothetical protein